jgi:hypothetical protein
MSNYIFYKDGTLQRPHGVSKSSYNSLEYGESVSVSYPQSSSLKIYNISGSTNQDKINNIKSLTNILKQYEGIDSIYSVSNYTGTTCCFVSIPSLLLQSGIEKGTVNLKYVITGTVAVTASDSKYNGILYNGSTAIGVVLYKEGFILLKDSSSLGTTQDKYFSSTLDDPRWVYWGISESQVSASSFDLDFKTIGYISTNTYLMHANKLELNHSNNETYMKSGSYSYIASSTTFKEGESSEIKNTIKSNFISGSAEFEKQTFITKIGMYDENKKLIAVASLANPARKTENREFTFKTKLDI